MIVSMHPLAADELAEGAGFYASQGRLEVAEDFVAEFERSVALIQAHPQIGATWRGRLRRQTLRRFPDSIVYYLPGEALRILALAHHKRRPGYWRARR